MVRKAFSPEQIVNRLREAQVVIRQRAKVAKAKGGKSNLSLSPKSQ